MNNEATSIDMEFLKTRNCFEFCPNLNNSLNSFNRISPGIKRWLAEIAFMAREDSTFVLHGLSLINFDKNLLTPLIERRNDKATGDGNQRHRPTSDYDLIQDCLQYCFEIITVSIARINQDYALQRSCAPSLDVLRERLSDIAPKLRCSYKKKKIE